MKMSIQDRVIDRIHTFDPAIDKEDIKPNAHFMDDLGMESLDHVEIIMLLEEEFDIEVEDDDAAKLMTVRSVVKYMEKHAKT